MEEYALALSNFIKILQLNITKEIRMFMLRLISLQMLGIKVIQWHLVFFL